MLKVIVYTFVNNERNNLVHTGHIFCNFILSFNFQDKAMLPKCTLLGVFYFVSVFALVRQSDYLFYVILEHCLLSS